MSQNLFTIIYTRSYAALRLISILIVDFQENGGVGDIQTQIPYFPL